MRYKVMTSCFVGVGMLAAAGMSFAETMPAKPSDPRPSVESTASPRQATGEVTFIEAKAGKLAVKTAEHDLSLNVQASAIKKILEAKAAESCALNLPELSVSRGHASVMVNPAFLRESIKVDQPLVVLWA